MIKHQFSGDSSKQVESIEFADGSSLSITSADELVQAISAFGARTSSLTSNDLTDAMLKAAGVGEVFWGGCFDIHAKCKECQAAYDRI